MGGLLSLGGLACCCSSAACKFLCSISNVDSSCSNQRGNFLMELSSISGSLCCAACPSCKNSTSARIMYALLLLLTTIVSCILLAPGLQDTLKSVPFCKDPDDPNPTNDNKNFLEEFVDEAKNTFQSPAKSFTVDCTEAIGYLAVYRLCFIVTLFFLLMSVLTIGVRSSKDPRAGLQNGFWGIKYLIIIGGMIGAFFIPHGVFGKVLFCCMHFARKEHGIAKYRMDLELAKKCTL